MEVKRPMHLMTSSETEAMAARKIGFPLVMKVVDPLHKSDVAASCWM